MSTPFAERLEERAQRLDTRICLGLDPRLQQIWPMDRAQPYRGEDDEAVGEAIQEWAFAILEALGGRVACVKPQVAFFEPWGVAGLRALLATCERARSLDLPVILDAKRGDIGSTSAAYAQAWLASRGSPERPQAPIADALTIHPWLGRDAVQPFLDVALAEGGGIFALVRTSNPGAKDLQELVARSGPAGLEDASGAEAPLYKHVAALLESMNAPVGASGYHALGAVAGATAPEALAEVRELLPRSVLLVPGYGAQGGGAADVAPAFDAQGRGAVINASRGLTDPWGAPEARPREEMAARIAAAEAMRAALAAL